MRILVLILILLVSVVMVAFGAQNTQTVEVSFFSLQSGAVSLSLVIIVQTRSGAEFLCVTGRSLKSEGRQSTEVFFQDFQRAPWSTHGDPKLDYRAISQIRVGWGGYYGCEKEVVQFTVGAPQPFRIQTRATPKISVESLLPDHVEARCSEPVSA